MEVINRVKTYHDKKIGLVVIGHKKMYVCNQCGRLVSYRIKSDKKIWCNKHYNQKKKGKIHDNIPRTMMDKNEIRFDNKVAYISLYNKKLQKIGEAIIDACDINKVRYTKWKLSSSGYVMNTPKFGASTKHLSRIIAGTDEFVDHIDHNPLNNRRTNLRTVTRSQNQMNVNYKGVFVMKNGKYYAHIKINQKLINLGHYTDKDEAYYARWFAEEILFKEYRYPKTKPKILPQREIEIQNYVNQKVQRL